MNYALLTDDGPVEIQRGLPLTVGDVQHPSNILDLWTSEELASIGIYPIVEPEIPAGHRIVETSLSFKDGGVERVAVTEPIPASVPNSVSAAQAKIVLFEDGIYDAVEQSCLNHPYFPVRIWWTSANEWERSHPYVSAMAADFDLTEEDVDDKFRRAALK